MTPWHNIALALLICAFSLFVLPACVYLCVKLGRAAWLRANSICSKNNTQTQTKDIPNGSRN